MAENIQALHLIKLGHNVSSTENEEEAPFSSSGFDGGQPRDVGGGGRGHRDDKGGGCRSLCPASRSLSLSFHHIINSICYTTVAGTPEWAGGQAGWRTGRFMGDIKWETEEEEKPPDSQACLPACRLKHV